MLFALKGTNSIHSYDKKAVIQKNKERKREGGMREELRGREIRRCGCPGGNKQMKEKKAKLAECYNMKQSRA